MPYPPHLPPSSWLNPSLRFTGEALSAICAALASPAPISTASSSASSPAVGGCCFRSWVDLMGSAADQLCFRDLAAEYRELPGRCERLLGIAEGEEF